MNAADLVDPMVAVAAELLAWCGAALSCMLCLPQALRTFRVAERLDAISPGTYWIVLANAMVWVTWSLLTGEFAVGAPALVNGPAAVLILCRLVAARRERRTVSIGAGSGAQPSTQRLLNWRGQARQRSTSSG